MREATAELGIPEANLTVHDFEVRTFPERRQDILELLIALWEEWRPDAVFQPSLHDVHQDHQVIAAEGLRAFKRTTILGYEIPWNNFDFAYQWYSALEKPHIERKAAALAKYASQQHRRYADPEYIWNVARTHGINVNREYAEVFQVYRVVDMITSLHALIYSDDPEATRAFLRDVLGWPYVEHAESEPGWLIFKTGPSELGVHPTSGDARRARSTPTRATTRSR